MAIVGLSQYTARIQRVKREGRRINPEGLVKDKPEGYRIKPEGQSQLVSLLLASPPPIFYPYRVFRTTKVVGPFSFRLRRDSNNK